MGLFDAFRTKTEPVFNAQRAMMTIVVAAILADGEASDEEVGRLRSMCARSPVFAANTKDEDDAVINYAVGIHRQFGFDGVRKAAAALSQGLREAAFAFATEIVLADGVVTDAEEQFIANLAGELGIDDGLARAVIQVTLIRLNAE